MTVGTQATEGSINQQLTSNALALRNILTGIAQFQEYIVSLGAAGLEALGFSSGDATTVMTLASYMNTVAGVYEGTVQQGGSGGTGAILFDFDNALCGLWAGQ